MSQNILPDRLEQIKDQILVVADYSSLEIGVAGDLHLRLFGDNQTILAYDAQLPKKYGGLGIDMHSNNAREVFGRWLGWTVPVSVQVEGKPVFCTYAGQRVDDIPVDEFKTHPYGAVLRDMIKAVFYGLAYGKSAYGFATLVGVDGKFIGEALADQMVNALLDAVPGMRRWFAWVEEFIRANFGIYSLGGRWCDLRDEIESGEEWQFKRALRRAWNFPCQATGAEVIGEAMRLIYACAELFALGFRIVLQVHDELVLRGPVKHVERAMALVKQHMCAATANGTKLLVKLQVSVGFAENYFDAK